MTGSMLVSPTGNVAISGQQLAIEKSNMREQHDDREANPAGSPLSNGSASSDHESDRSKEDEITKLRPNDCILGRGGFTNNYVGNSNFRKLVNEHKVRYLSCSKMDKPKVARDVVRLWKEMDPPGRFLQKKEDRKTSKRGELTVWVECSDKKAQEKASQSLRERTPDVLPYLSKLQEHRDQVREKGVSMISQHYQGSSSCIDQVGNDHVISDIAHASVVSPGDLNCPNMTGSGSMTSLQLQQQSFMDQSMNSSMNSANMMQMNAMNNINNRRMSMPSGSMPNGHHTSAVVTPLNMRQQMTSARRTSIPTVNHLQGGNGLQHPSHGMMGQPDMAFSLEQQRQQVLQDAYSAVERHGSVDAQASQMFMEQMMMREREMMQLREREMIHRQAMMREQCMMQQQQQLQMPHPSFAGSMGLRAVTRDCDVMMPEHENLMLAAAQKQQQLLQESMKESMGNGYGPENRQMLQQNTFFAQNMPSHVHSVRLPSRKSVELEPLPLDVDDDENYVIPLDMIPDVAKSAAEGFQAFQHQKVSETKSSKTMLPTNATNRNKGDRQGRGGATSTSPVAAIEIRGDSSKIPPPPPMNSEVSVWTDGEREMLEGFSPMVDSVKKLADQGSSNDKKENQRNHDTIPLNDTTVSRPGKLKSAFKRPSSSSAGGTAGKSAAHSGASPEDYHKTLRNYMTNHHIAATGTSTVDIDDDISDSEGDVEGVDTTAWIQQALHDSGDLATPRSVERKKKRKSARQDAASQDGSQLEGEAGIGAASGHSRATLLKDDLMSTDGKSMDCKSLDCMSFMSLAMSEMEKSMEELHVSRTPDDVEVDSDMDSETINFGSHHGDRRTNRSSNQSVMSELTDFSDNDESDDDEVGGDDGDDGL